MLNAVKSVMDFVLHIDKNLLFVTQQYGMLSYAFLFGILFMETGFVLMPFLPGDSLLFAAGSLSSFGAFNIWRVLAVSIVAAFLGDTVNYWIGRFVGPQIFERDNRFIKKAHLKKAHEFYEKHGAFAIVLSRFVPIVRTFAPFVAGISQMSYMTFLMYNLLGGVLWVLLFTLAGFFFGNIPVVRDHFELAMVAIILVSVVPVAIELIKARQHKV